MSYTENASPFVARFRKEKRIDLAFIAIFTVLLISISGCTMTGNATSINEDNNQEIQSISSVTPKKLTSTKIIIPISTTI